jgi:hypothetical protein
MNGEYGSSLARYENEPRMGEKAVVVTVGE